MNPRKPIKHLTWHLNQKLEWPKLGWPGLFELWKTHLKLDQDQIDDILASGGIHFDGKRIDPLPTIPPSPCRIDLYWGKIGNVPQITLSHLLFENDQCIAVNKPAGLATQATRLSTKDCLEYQLKQLTRQNDLMAVHRLDTPTSGLVLFGKGKQHTAELMKLFSTREVEKTYRAVVSPTPQETEFTIKGYLKRDASRLPANVFKLVASDSCLVTSKEQGKWSETRFKILEAKKNEALLEVQPITGRTHQIRAHLASIGCPIVGDDLYGSKVESERLMLHAWKLKIHDLELEAKPEF